VLYYHQQLTMKQIASLLDITESRVSHACECTVQSLCETGAMERWRILISMSFHRGAFSQCPGLTAAKDREERKRRQRAQTGKREPARQDEQKEDVPESGRRRVSFD